VAVPASILQQTRLGGEARTRHASVDGARLNSPRIVSVAHWFDSPKPDGDLPCMRLDAASPASVYVRAATLKAIVPHFYGPEGAITGHDTMPRRVARSPALCRCGTLGLSGCKGLGLLLLVPVPSEVLVTKRERLYFS
jgi:hypothetical protein